MRLAVSLLLGALVSLGATAATSSPHRSHAHHRRLHTQVGVASYYGVHHAGRKTASGGRLAPDRLTAASRTLPLGTRATVTNRKNGDSVQVRVTDRGPFAKNRILDVSPKAARMLGMTHDGVAPVKVRPVRAPAGAR
ncbi:MAG TPA: septal ring lytic transglycosylase RlpA family protein [Phenylobacterium sp.]|jgi:rare lipoprotein A|nr:septal ring lytic transglycosylase RlpA family protein [Phenylobacterium sp.]